MIKLIGQQNNKLQINALQLKKKILINRRIFNYCLIS